MRRTATHNRMQDGGPAATHELAADALALPSALLASVSHDLRNPLSVVLGAAEVLQDGFVHLTDDDRHAYLRAIRRECVRMDEYIQGLFHITRLVVGGTARVVREWIGIDELVDSAVQRLVRYRDDARVSVERALIDVGSPLQPVRGHRPLLEQALLNVLDNAAKFSPPAATIGLRIRQHADAATEIEVLDAGPGIPPAQRERVFASFVSDDPQSLGRAGTGLGLAISRSILRAHGGDVVAEDPGHGTTGARVRLTLPAQEAGTRSSR